MADKQTFKTFEDAKRCPKCGNPGEAEGDRTQVSITCRNPRCLWFETPWIVDLKGDGLVWEGDREVS